MSDLRGPRKETVRITLPPRPTPGALGRDTTRLPAPPAAHGPGANPEPGRRVVPPPPPPSRKVPPPPPGAAAQLPPPPAVFPSPPLTSVKPEPAPEPPPPPAEAPPPVVSTPMPPRPRVLPPPPRLASPVGSSAAAPAAYAASPSLNEPRKETARITILPEPSVPAAATVKMAKTQPLQTAPPPKPSLAPPVSHAPTPEQEPAGPFAILEAVPLPVCWIIFAFSTLILLIQIWHYFSA